MGRAARAAGYEYLAITDHSAVVGTRLDPDGLRDHIDAIRSLSGSDEVDGITLLAGSEVNIAPDGSLDYDDDVLAELDWVVASVHSSFAMDAAAMTERIVHAIENPLVDVIGHLTGRKIERAPGIRGRLRGRADGGRPIAHDARDQLEPRPAGPR